MQSFLSLANLQQCELRFRTHVHARYGIVIPDDQNDPTSIALKQTLYQVMRDVKKSCSTSTPEQQRAMTLKDLNNRTLNATRDVLFKIGNLTATATTATAAPTVEPRSATTHRSPVVATTLMGGATTASKAPGVSRDLDVYGDRHLHFNHLRPETTSPSDRRGTGGDAGAADGGSEYAERQYENALRSRGDMIGIPPPPGGAAVNAHPAVAKPSGSMGGGFQSTGQAAPGAPDIDRPGAADTVESFTLDEFQQRLALLESEREKEEGQFAAAAPAAEHNKEVDGQGIPAATKKKSEDDGNAASLAQSSHVMDTFVLAPPRQDIDYTELLSIDGGGSSANANVNANGGDQINATDLRRLVGPTHTHNRIEEEDSFSMYSLRPPLLMPPLPDAHAASRSSAPGSAAATPAFVISENYIAINGFDRDYVKFPYRYNFDVTLAGDAGTTANDAATLQSSYKNVAWIEATCLVLPMDVLGGAAATAAEMLGAAPTAIGSGSTFGTATSSGPGAGAALVYKPHYTHSFGLANQYVTLRVSNVGGAYDGTNDVLRLALALFVFDRSYQAPNGRGYVVLRPMQAARRRFLTPLASLPPMTFSFTQPMNMLMNNSTDQYTVTQLFYEPQNRLFLKMRCAQYFDGNEFYIGDRIILRGFSITPAQGTTNLSPYASLDAFVNRAQGHDIVQLGKPNDQGFYRSFYILAPGVLDQTLGRVIVDSNILDAVNALGDPNAPASVGSPGRLLNASLQVAVSLTVGTLGPAFPTAAAELQQPMRTQL